MKTKKGNEEKSSLNLDAKSFENHILNVEKLIASKRLLKTKEKTSCNNPKLSERKALNKVYTFHPYKKFDVRSEARKEAIHGAFSTPSILTDDLWSISKKTNPSPRKDARIFDMSDEVYHKLHHRLEIIEKERNAFDRDWRHSNSEGKGLGTKEHVEQDLTLCRDQNAIAGIKIMEKLPVIAFGRQIPEFKKCFFKDCIKL